MEEQVVIDLESEKKEILKRYRGLLRACRRTLEKGDKLLIRKAFDIALEAHKDTRRKSGEPYIYHPLAVAQLCVSEIGLGPTSVICALLHDTVEDTDITLKFVEQNFGKKVAVIIDGLTKIFNLTEGEKYLLLNSGVGQGLFFAGAKHVAIQIIASFTEHKIITTNPEEVLQKRKEDMSSS